MRYAPAYSAERFPGDFVASAKCGLLTGILLGPLTWWLARSYLLQVYPNHREILDAAIVAGVLDGALLGVLAFVACFALRIWRFERIERKRSDAALRAELECIAEDRERGSGGAPPLPLP